MSHSSRSKLLTAILVVLALAAVGARFHTLVNMDRSAMCGSDFPVFYGGGQLLGTPALYSWSSMQELEHRYMGCSIRYAVFIRLPYFAAIMKVWNLLPFWTAFWLWRACSVIAIGFFIWCGPGQRRWALAACACSLPLHDTITNGQDDAFLLFWLALAFLLLKNGWKFSAGCALAMCAAKFHLFLLLPLLLLYHRRVLLGAVSAGGTILLSCFAFAGNGWPKEFLAAITNNVIDPNPTSLPNVRGLADSNISIEIALSVLIVLVAFYVIRRGDFQFGVSAVIVGGLLLSHHYVRGDGALLLPVALVLAWHPQAHYSKVAAIYLASPLAYVLPGAVQALVMLLLLCILAYEIRNLGESRKRLNYPRRNSVLPDLSIASSTT